MPSLKDRELNSPSDSRATTIRVADNSSRQQPVAIEVPVTVNGARAIQSSEKREPFSESTKTLLIFGNGAVIRLGSAVAPGQLLFLTNKTTKKEVICQVLKPKNSSKSSGYVEVEFTEPSSDFWGLSFPADHAPLRSRTSSSDPDSDADEFLRRAMDTCATLAQEPNSVRPNFGPADDRFKTGPTSDELGSSRADLPAEAPASAKLESHRLQEQVAARLSAEQRPTPVERLSTPAGSKDQKALIDTTAKLIETAEANSQPKTSPEVTSASESEPSKSISGLVNASSAAKSNFPAEELEVPSWLQPLTRKNGPSVQPEETENSLGTGDESKSTEEEKQSKTLRNSKAAQPAPDWGSGLVGQSDRPADPQGNSKGLFIAIAAGLLVAVAGATWYFQQPFSLGVSSRSSRATSAPPPPSPAAAPATDAGTTASQREQAQPVPADTTMHVVASPLLSKPASGVGQENAPASSSARLTQQPAIVTERIPNSNAAANAPSTESSSSLPESVEPEPKKPSLGDVSLTKPKVKRRAQSAGVVAPSLTEADAQALPPDASLGAGLVPDAASQPPAPAAPIAVGGDVKPVRLLSSVQPVYPSIAKNQHLSGDVRIDALIDSTGRISSMKVISGPPLLRQAATDALRQWKYQPATLNGEPVPMHATVTLQFHLQ